MVRRLAALVTLVAIGGLMSPARLAAADPPDRAAADAALVKTAQGMLAGLRTHTLPNGLRVYLLPVPNSPVVTTMVAYKVGSGDEEKDQTGLSHYLEHLLFKGTDKLLPGDIDRATQRNGGHNNAYTNEDMTVYHFDFAADKWQTPLEIEADRMRNVRIDAKHEFEQEKGAVIAELAQGEDSPWELEGKTILPLLFPKESPYSHPVIGQEVHVRAATAEVIKRHYDKWYHPNNAALVVVGGIDPDAVLAKVKELFGPIPRGDLPTRKAAPARPAPAELVRKEFPSKFDVPRLVVGFNTIAVDSPDDPVLDVVSTILGDGKTARLYKALVEGAELASAATTANSSGRYPGWFGVYVELLKGADRAKAEGIVFAELEKLAAAPPTAAEVERARRKLLANYVFGRESVHRLADSVARASTYPGGEDVAKFYADYLARLGAVTPADVQKAVKAYLGRKQAAVVWSVPKEEGKGGAGRTGAGLLERGPPARTRSGPPARAPGAGFSLTAAKRTVLPNGLVLITLEDHRVPIVVAGVEVKDPTLREPADKAGVAALVGDLLDEGTDKHTGEEIAALIEDAGGDLGFSSSGGSLKVLTPDTDLGLGLLFDSIVRPSFPADAIERKRGQLLSAIADAETQPRTRARTAFQKAVYGDHPYGRSSLGRKEVVEKLTADDLRAFHKAAFAPDQAVVVVAGDIDPAKVAERVEELTKDWRPAKAQPPAVPAPPKATAVAQKVVSDPAAAQVHVYVGHLGVTRQNPDYYRLLVLDNVLGTGPGFTDRLSATLRDRQGLAYTVNAAISSTAGNQPGTFVGYIGTFPDKFVYVRDGFVKEVNRIRDEAPTAQEVEDAKKYLLASLPFRFTTLSAVAAELLAAERYGLGFDFLEAYRKEVAAVTPADVQAAARKYLDPKALAVVAVGPIDAEGKPLTPPKGK
ncbi:MAG: insulinase family protein [Gemmataceae bacterium]|nr:insulinase family protein [Gemmataceae bacterium]